MLETVSVDLIGSFADICKKSSKRTDLLYASYISNEKHKFTADKPPQASLGAGALVLKAWIPKTSGQEAVEVKMVFGIMRPKPPICGHSPSGGRVEAACNYVAADWRQRLGIQLSSIKPDMQMCQHVKEHYSPR